MNEKYFDIQGVPAVLWGEDSDSVVLFIHGQSGSKAEAEAFYQVAGKKGWQVLGIDLPCHGGRQDGVQFLPWEAVPELQAVLKYIRMRWQHVAVRANSIGAWFSMLAFQNEKIDKRLFVSPILDMSGLIEQMMQWAGVSREQLEKEGEIATDFGQVLSWQYLQYAISNPAKAYCDTRILYAELDNMTPYSTVQKFAESNSCSLTVMPQGEHWFHTPEQLKFMSEWEDKML